MDADRESDAESRRVRSVRRRWIVAGRVQGVFYRRSAQQCAQKLGITGQAVNLADGRVQVDAWGEAAALESFGAWLALGPTLARVTSVQPVSLDATEATDAPPLHFTTG